MKRRRLVHLFPIIILSASVVLLVVHVRLSSTSVQETSGPETFLQAYRKRQRSATPILKRKNDGAKFDLQPTTVASGTTTTVSSEALTDIEHNFTFHAWGPEGIELDPMLRYIKHTYYKFKKYEKDWYARLYGPFHGFVAMHNGSRPMIWLPKKVLKRRIKRDIVQIRLKPLLPHFQHALMKTLFDYPHRFRPLLNVLEQVGSFPVVFQLDDYRGCLKDNYNMSRRKKIVKKALPFMSFCRQKGCNYSFPVPTYTTYLYATIPKNGTWDEVMEQWNINYPKMEDKAPKAFWRGGCSSGGLGHRTVFAQKTLDAGSDHLDVATTQGLFNCPPGFPESNRTPPEESMRYRAVLDVDGNSWSERFPRLLCYNSVVIKVNVEPDHDEYFMQSLTPGIHYLPATLDNYTAVAKWAVQDSNLPEIKQIVKNANAWCKLSMRPDRLNYDFLTVLNGVVEGMNNNDPGWTDRWREVQEAYLGEESYSGHEGFASQVWPFALLDATPDMRGLQVTNLSQMTKAL